MYLTMPIGLLNDIEQGFGQVQSDSKDLKQLQLEQTKIKVLVCIIIKSILYLNYIHMYSGELSCPSLPSLSNTSSAIIIP